MAVAVASFVQLAERRRRSSQTEQTWKQNREPSERPAETRARETTDIYYGYNTSCKRRRQRYAEDNDMNMPHDSTATRSNIIAGRRAQNSSSTHAHAEEENSLQGWAARQASSERKAGRPVMFNVSCVSFWARPVSKWMKLISRAFSRHAYCCELLC